MQFLTYQRGTRSLPHVGLLLIFKLRGQLQNLWAPGQSWRLVHGFWKLCILSSVSRARRFLPHSAGPGLGPGHPTDINAARLMGRVDREPGLWGHSPRYSLCSALFFPPLSPGRLGHFSALGSQVSEHKGPQRWPSATSLVHKSGNWGPDIGKRLALDDMELGWNPGALTPSPGLYPIHYKKVINWHDFFCFIDCIPAVSCLNLPFPSLWPLLWFRPHSLSCLGVVLILTVCPVLICNPAPHTTWLCHLPASPSIG